MQHIFKVFWWSLIYLPLTTGLFIQTKEKYDKFPERKIIILISSYNNPLELTVECLKSALKQKYSNFEIVFCDDCSPQPNIEQIHRDLIAKIDTHHRITYRRNKERYRPMGNQWLAWNSINPDNILDNNEIIIVNLDGDDVLLHRNVLKIINKLHHLGAWVTWGQCLFYPSKESIPACKDVSDSVRTLNTWRDIPFCFGHIRSYRLSLLKSIPLETFLHNGNFYPAAGDVILMWSLCEKAG
jgi:glycosyltransferase involved in cell wall biosynthesis